MIMSPEALATARARHAHNIRPCGGTCGRDTRSSKVPKHLFPETVLRNSATHCTTCLRDEKDEVLKAEGLPVPTRGPSGSKEMPPERLQKLKDEAEAFTAARRLRLAQAKRGDLRHRMMVGPVRISA